LQSSPQSPMWVALVDTDYSSPLSHPGSHQAGMHASRLACWHGCLHGCLIVRMKLTPNAIQGVMLGTHLAQFIVCSRCMYALTDATPSERKCPPPPAPRTDLARKQPTAPAARRSHRLRCKWHGGMGTRGVRRERRCLEIFCVTAAALA